MSKRSSWISLAMITLGFGIMSADMAFAEGGSAPAGTGTTVIGNQGLARVGAGIGAGLVVMGGAAGIGRIGGSSVESMARQPEVAGTINTAMLITAAMIEGATLFAVVVCLLAVF